MEVSNGWITKANGSERTHIQLCIESGDPTTSYCHNLCAWLCYISFHVFIGAISTFAYFST